MRVRTRDLRAVQHRSEIRGQLLGVLMRIEDRITFDQAKLIRGVIDVDELGVALEQSADVLLRTRWGCATNATIFLMLNGRLGMGECDTSCWPLETRPDLISLLAWRFGVTWTPADRTLDPIEP